jgi:hypothetical protein
MATKSLAFKENCRPDPTFGGYEESFRFELWARWEGRAQNRYHSGNVSVGICTNILGGECLNSVPFW